MAENETYKKTLQFQAFQLGVVTGIAFAGFYGAFFREQGATCAIIAGSISAIIVVVISLIVIKTL
jgi:hypothetical protein